MDNFSKCTKFDILHFHQFSNGTVRYCLTRNFTTLECQNNYLYFVLVGSHQGQSCVNKKYNISQRRATDRNNVATESAIWILPSRGKNPLVLSMTVESGKTYLGHQEKPSTLKLCQLKHLYLS